MYKISPWQCPNETFVDSGEEMYECSLTVQSKCTLQLNAERPVLDTTIEFPDENQPINSTVLVSVLTLCDLTHELGEKMNKRTDQSL